MEVIPRPTYLPDSYRLENLATIAYASTLWDKTSAEKFFLLDKQEGSQNHINQMVKEKEKTLQNACLPQCITDRILCLFKLMGQRISLWSEYSTKVLKLPRYVAVTLKWTNWGAIDEKKIFEYWINSNPLRHVPPVPKQAVYYTACCNVSIDYIRLHWKEILKFCEIHSTDQPFLYELREPKLKFIICSIIFLAKLELSQLFQSQKRYFNDFNKSRIGNMFRLSVEGGCPIAVQYYWTLLNATEKRSGLLFAADFSLTKYNPPFDFFREENDSFFRTELHTIRIYKTKCFADLFMFALTRMSEEEFTEFYVSLDMKDIFTTLSLLMYHSPSEEFLPLAFDMLLKLCSEVNDYKNIKTKVLEIMVWNNAFGLYNKQYFHRKLCMALWKKLRSSNSLEEILQSEKSFLELTYKVFDFELLNFIINTDCEEKYRNSYILIGKPWFRKLVENDEYELLWKFEDGVLKSNENRNFFRTCLRSFCKDFMLQDRFDVVDKLLSFFSKFKIGVVEWLSISSAQDILDILDVLDRICSRRAERRNYIKKQLNVFSVCAWAICQNQIQTADNAIQWMFDSEEEKQNYIKNVLDRKLYWIYEIWRFNKSKFLENVRRFLLWILESEDEVHRFKSEKLLSENGVPNLFASLFKNIKSPDGKQKGSEIFEIADELLTSSLPSENITILKHKIGEKVRKWITVLGNQFCLHRIDDFLEWVFPTGNEKIEAVKTILKNNDFWGSISVKESKKSLCDENVLRSWIKTTGFEGVEINADEAENAEHPALCKAVFKILKNGDKGIGPNAVTDCNYIRCEKKEVTR